MASDSEKSVRYEPESLRLRKERAASPIDMEVDEAEELKLKELAPAAPAFTLRSRRARPISVRADADCGDDDGGDDNKRKSADVGRDMEPPVPGVRNRAGRGVKLVEKPGKKPCALCGKMVTDTPNARCPLRQDGH